MTMNIEYRNIPIRDLVKGYMDNDEQGVVGFGGDLDIRPPYQREFVYNDAQQQAVINTVMQGFPLNTFYWATRDDDDTFEVLDGQQRTLSICKYVNRDFAVDFRYFHNLTDDECEAFLDYELMVFVVSGTDSEKLSWFRTINIAGAKLTDQELRNAVYHGPWLSDAKRYLSKTNCAGYNLGKHLIGGSPIRQDFLETAIRWVAYRDHCAIEDYMAQHSADPNANDLWTYYQNVINWANLAFPMERREMKQVDWGALYREHGSKQVDGAALETRVAALMADEDVTKKSGIYAYVLDGKERHLNIRAFTPRQRREAYERQGGLCAVTKQPLPIEQMEADHIIPWSKGGRTDAANCQMISIEENRAKSDK